MVYSGAINLCLDEVGLASNLSKALAIRLGSTNQKLSARTSSMLRFAFLVSISLLAAFCGGESFQSHCLMLYFWQHTFGVHGIYTQQ
jgi:hypothetical protein